MWKCFSRRTKELFWRNSFTSNRPIQSEKYRQICCFPRDGQCNGERDDSQEKSKKRPIWEANAQVQQHNWIGALGWSGILVLGWYLSQPTRLRSLLCCNVQPDELKYKCPGQYLIFHNSVFAQPVNQILAKSITSEEQILENAPHFAHESLDQAAENFAQAHGSVENRLGIELARRKRHNEAALLFQKAADRGHATAAFNMGLCHEMGLGATQDFHKAAKYYEIASVGGHATATYNLGVFYVHGWGGKPADRVQARQLFVVAARLGQADARRALGMTETNGQKVIIEKTVKPLKNDVNSYLLQDSVLNYTAMLEA